MPRDWFVKAAPLLKLLTGTLSLVVPVASSATKLVLDEAGYKGIERPSDLGQKSLGAVLKGGEKAGAWLDRRDAPDLERGEAIEAYGAMLRQLKAWLKEKDPGAHRLHYELTVVNLRACVTPQGHRRAGRGRQSRRLPDPRLHG